MPAAGSPAPAPAAEGTEITSPMVGTFYRSPSPEAESYVNVGDSIEDESVVCIIEAMKVMTTVPAPRGGVVGVVMVSDGATVEAGTPLVRIR